MKKRTLMAAAAILALICALTVTAFCSEDLLEAIEQFTEPFTEETSEEPFDEETAVFSEEATEAEIGGEFSVQAIEASFEAFEVYLAENDFDESEKAYLENRFMSTALEYSMTESELKYISTLINENYDIDILMNIYGFLRGTDADIEMTELIYTEGIKNSDRDFWIYDTYDILLDRSDDMLSVEDVANYIGRGLGVEEIVGAYELSFAGVKTTKQMLEERLEGSNWNTIAGGVVSCDENVFEDADELYITDILYLRNEAIKLRKDISEIIAIDDGHIAINDDAILALAEISKLKSEFSEKYNVKNVVITEEKASAKNGVVYESEFDIEAAEYYADEDDIPEEEPEV